MTNIYALGPFRLEPDGDLLLRGSEPLALGRRAIALLRRLVEQPGAVVSKDALIEAAWPGQTVEESNLTVQIAALRRVLGETPGGDRWIETMPRRGYRFVGPVITQEENGLAAAPPRIDAVRDTAPERQGDAERRQITAMSCELAGVPARADGTALEDLRESVGAFRRRVSETVGRHDGFIARPSPHNPESAVHPTISQLEPAARFEREDSPAAKSDKQAATVPSGPSRRPNPQQFLIAAGVVALIGIASAAWWGWLKENSPPVAVETPAATSQQTIPITASAPAPRLSFVVLPFANLSNDPDQEYFADGITEDLTTDLSRISGSFVIARNTAFTHKGKPVDAKQIGRELGVRYIIEGSMQRSADQVQINVQLIDAETGAHVWADRFDTDRRNLAEAQSEITGRLARTLHLELVETAAARIEQEQPADPDASDLAMRGLAWFYRPRSAATLQEAQRLFERSLQIDPRSVDARIGLAMALVSSVGDGWSSSAQLDEARAERLLVEALERDPNRSMAHYALGRLRRMQKRLPESQIELETAVALDRNNALARLQLANTLLFMGQPEAAIPQFGKSIRLSPNDPSIYGSYNSLGICYVFLGGVDEAIDLLRKARAANPRLYYIHLYLAGALGLRGDLDEARAMLAEGIKLRPDVNSLAAWRTARPWITNPPYWTLLEKTFNVGLRRAGFPEE